uniref:Uncharacterized protein n=1 Tax=Arion vulgaris TaxID=1028688 RepID=A0A0B7ACW0_9EUPU
MIALSAKFNYGQQAALGGNLKSPPEQLQKFYDTSIISKFSYGKIWCHLFLMLTFAAS